MKPLIVLMLVICVSSGLFPQALMINGSVRDAETGEPLPYANIRVANTTFGTASNLHGEFLLKLPSLPSTVVISYVGYATDSMTITSSQHTNLSLSLKKQSIVMAEVEVVAQNKSVAELVRRVYQKIQEEEGQVFTGKAFYRQYAQGDTTYTEVLEIFFETLLNSSGIVEKAIEQGRYAMARRAQGDTTPNFSVSNLSDLSTQYSLSQHKDSFLSFLPFVRKTIAYRPIREDAENLFFFSEDGVYESEGRKIIVVSFIPKPNLDKPAFSGSMRIDLQDLHVVSIEKTLNDPRIDLFPYEYLGGYYQTDYVLTYKAGFTRSQSGDYRMTFFETRLSSKEKHRLKASYEKKRLFRSFLVFYGYEDRSAFDPKGKPTENSDVANIRNLQYDPEFWNRHQDVLNEIPLEEHIKQSFMARGFYGNLFPGGIKVPAR